MIELDEAQRRVVEASDSHIMCIACAGAGKALENGSLVYTADGPKKIEDCKINDEIYCEDGKLHKITGVFPQGKKKKYNIYLTDGNVISCCDEHIWTFKTESQRSHKSKSFTTKTLREIIDENLLYSRTTKGFSEDRDKQYNRRNIWLPMTLPVEFPKKELPLDPYTLGALLGDGYLKCGGSTFSNEDLDVLEKVESGLSKIECSLKKSESRKFDYRIMQQGTHGKLGTFSTIIRDLGLENKHSDDKFIPDIYKYSCVEDRLELLKGIIDTDGYCDGSNYDIVLKSKQLILDVKEICESLGLTATFQEKKAICTNSAEGKKDCGIVYRLYIKQSNLINKIHSSKKRESQWKEARCKASRAFDRIEETNEYVEMTCISVDNPTHLFLTNNFIVTHNTRTLTERIKYLVDSGIDPQDIVAITYTNAAAEEMRERLPQYTADCFIGTIHAYAYKLLLSQGVKAGKAIEEERFDKFFDLIKKNDIRLPKIKHLLVDEFQDVSHKQYEFFVQLDPDNYFFVMDDYQAIYNFDEYDPGDVQIGIDLVNDENWKTYFLKTNYRSGVNIIRFANRFVTKMKNKVFKSIRPASLDEGIVEERGNFSINDLVRDLSNMDEWGKWFILVRTNREIDDIMRELDKRGIDCATFKKADLNKDGLKKVLERNCVKVLTIHSAKGLESDYVAVCAFPLAMFGYARWDTNCRLLYVAATRARKKLIWYYK